MTSQRPYNFSPGPGCQPLECLEQLATDLIDWNGKGLSVAETSHRSPEWAVEMDDIRGRLRSLLNIPDSHCILFMAGGASLQFSAIPFNLIGDYTKVDYLVTGHWSHDAYEECRRLNFPGVEVNCVIPIANEFTGVPDQSTWKVSEDAAYFFFCSNESAHGIQIKEFPNVAAPLVIDMSSDFLSRPIRDWTKVGLIFACAQKNFGLAGMSVVVMRKDLLERKVKAFCPLTLDYRVQAKYGSMYNTPPTIPIHFANTIFKWIEKQGGVRELNRRNKNKAAKLYDAIDRSPHFMNAISEKNRSDMNVTFVSVVGGRRVMDDAVDKKFLDFCKERNIVTLKGFKAVGGYRASIYNAMPEEGVDALVRAIEDFPGFD